MGFFKSISLVVVSFILFLVFLSSIFSLIVSSSLNYDTLAPRLKIVVQNFTESNFNLTPMVYSLSLTKKSYCKSHDFFNLTNFKYNNISLSPVPCSFLNQTNSSNLIISYEINTDRKSVV